MSTIYQLNIELAGSHPKIWRRISLPSDTPFDNLHDIIQISMGWKNQFAYEFIINDTAVFDFGPEIDMGDNPNERDALDAVLDELVTVVKARFTYIYDFDDRWQHDITLEKILSSGEAPAYPVCLGGEGACPPDGCGGISRYQQMLDVLADERHPEHNNIKEQLGEPEDVLLFDLEEANARLKDYSEQWEQIYRETEQDIADLEIEDADSEFGEDEVSEPGGDKVSDYESVKHLKSPRDLLNDERGKRVMAEMLDKALKNREKKSCVEYKTFMRLIKQGQTEEKSKEMIVEAFSVQLFYSLKYGMDLVDDRYDHNLDRLPHTPEEIPSLDYAVYVLNNCMKGIPFAAIEYLHNDTSAESTSAIVKELKNFSDHQYCWADCITTPFGMHLRLKDIYARN